MSVYIIGRDCGMLGEPGGESALMCKVCTSVLCPRGGTLYCRAYKGLFLISIGVHGYTDVLLS